MNEILARLWQNLYARVTGPMNLRLIIQPAVATILAIRAGLRDAHQDRAPFFWAVLWNPAHRRELLREGWKDVGKVFLIATILDVVYQLIVHRGFYILELLITAVTLAIVPYVCFAARSVASQKWCSRPDPLCNETPRRRDDSRLSRHASGTVCRWDVRS